MKKKKLTLDMIKKAVERAKKGKRAEALVLPIVFPNALGVTEQDLDEWSKRLPGKDK